MASADNCYTPLKGFLMRVVRLDACGTPLTGASNTVMMEDFTTIEFALEYDPGQEFITKNAQGNFIVNEKDADRIKRVNLTQTFGVIDPALLDIQLGEPIGPSGAPVGTVFSEERNTTKFSLEVWGGVAGTLCEDGEVVYEYMVVPWVENAHFGNTSTAYAPGELQIMATSHRASGFSGYADAPALPRAFGPKDHMMRFRTTTPPPDPDVDGVFCGFQPLAPALV